MSEENPEDLTDLDPAIVERLRNGTATKGDEIAKLEYWRRNAIEYNDPARVEVLDAQLSALRVGE